METLYDVQQLLKKFDILVYVGKRKWDAGLMALELDNLHYAGVISQKDYLTTGLILRQEYEVEEKSEEES